MSGLNLLAVRREASDESFDGPVTYQVIESGTQRLKRGLIDSKGYTYTIKRHKDDHTYWSCALRTKYKRCSATVTQDGRTFKAGRHDHSHEAKQGNVAARILSSKIKEEACKDTNATSSTIVGKVVLQSVGLQNPVYDMPFHNNLIRKANRVRQKMKQDYTCSMDLDFKLDENFMPPTFLKEDLRVGTQRHLIFATNTQIELMASAKIWYLDENYSQVYQPFKKILVISTYICSGEGAIFVPLLFILMSECSEKEYNEVLSAVLNQLPHPPRMCKIIAEFDEPLWRSLMSTFPSAHLQGCAFHWGRLIWNKAQRLGIKAESLKTNESQQKVMSKILALPLFPPELIKSAHDTLCSMEKDHKSFKKLLDYIGKTWVSSSFWDVSSWSNYMHPLRMRTEVEGWLHRLTEHLAQENSVFYSILWFLHQESEKIPVGSKNISERQLKNYQRKESNGIKKQIFSLWDEYSRGTKACNFVSLFLNKLCLVYNCELII